MKFGQLVYRAVCQFLRCVLFKPEKQREEEYLWNSALRKRENGVKDDSSSDFRKVGDFANPLFYADPHWKILHALLIFSLFWSVFGALRGEFWIFTKMKIELLNLKFRFLFLRFWKKNRGDPFFHQRHTTTSVGYYRFWRRLTLKSTWFNVLTEAEYSESFSRRIIIVTPLFNFTKIKF